MTLFQGALLLILGYGLLAVVYRSLATGWLPFGTNGFKGRLEVHRATQPFGYWSAYTFYSGFGVWFVFLGLAILNGRLEPLPLS